MKKISILLLLIIFMSCNNDQKFLEKTTIIKSIENVADYELANPSVHDHDLKLDFVNGWVPATFYVSLIPLYEATNNDKYLNKVKEWGERSKWDCAPRFRHADDLASGQVFLDLYRHDKNDLYVNNLRTRLDSLVKTAIPGREDWHWCDALFMAPPVYMMAGTILNDKKYHNYVDEMYWDVYEYLYDKEESLFYRDSNYFTKKSPNGTKLFWGRGNGWVIGGLARLIPYIKNDTSKKRYIKLFKDMAARIATLQQEDGLWRSNLLDINHMPGKETSCSSFYVYALSWGINKGILNEKKYLPIVEKGWVGLSKCIDQSSGKLGYVQPIGAAPGDTTKDTTMSYGAGAFVLAGTEILKLIDKKQTSINSMASH